MTDRYLELANTNLTKSLFDGLGLPDTGTPEKRGQC